MGINLVILVVLLSTVSGIPLLILDVCSESEVTFTCTVNDESDYLHWEVDFLSGGEIDRVTYMSTDVIGLHQHANHPVTNVLYNFNLTSNSPLTSTMTTNTPTDLSGATVLCFSKEESDLATLALHRPPRPVLLSISVPTTSRSEAAQEIEVTLDVTLHWNTAENNEDNRVNLNTSYVVTIISEQLESNSSTIMTTSNTSIQLALYCDQEYNISVVARNCVGTSEPAETHITRDYFGHCPVPQSNMISSNITFESRSRLVYRCLPGLQPQGEMVSICTDNGTWQPNPDVIVCTSDDEDRQNFTNVDVNGQSNRGTIIILSSVSVVFIFVVALALILSLFVTVWLHRRKHDSTQAVEHSQNDYTEVERLHQQQDEDPGYVQVDLELNYNLTENHSTFSLISELQNPLYQNVTDDHNPDESLNLDSLLIQLRVQVTSKWREFGAAIGVPDDLLDQYSSYPVDECLIEVLNYWLNSCQNPTWRDVAKVLRDIELQELAEDIMNVYETGRLPIEVDADDSDSEDNILLPLPIPSNMLSPKI